MGSKISLSGGHYQKALFRSKYEVPLLGAPRVAIYEPLFRSHYKGHYLGAAIRTHYLVVTVKEPLLLRKRSFSVTQGHLWLSDFFSL